jgi:hypothetical protein
VGVEETFRFWVRDMLREANTMQIKERNSNEIHVYRSLDKICSIIKPAWNHKNIASLTDSNNAQNESRKYNVRY